LCAIYKNYISFSIAKYNFRKIKNVQVYPFFAEFATHEKKNMDIWYAPKCFCEWKNQILIISEPLSNEAMKIRRKKSANFVYLNISMIYHAVKLKEIVRND
jgi:hypothetical protein